jgi:hypothetical protein
LVKRPEDYPWSSHKEYRGERSDLVDKELLLALVNKREYLDFINEGVEKIKELSYPTIVRGQFVGTPFFVTTMSRKLSRRGKTD